MNKLKATLVSTFLFMSVVIYAQTSLTKENTQDLEVFCNNLTTESGTYLLSFDDTYDDALLIYKYQDEIKLYIYSFTFNSTDFYSSDLKNKVEKLNGSVAQFDQVNDETGEVIKVISTYKFELPSNDLDSLKKIIESVLLKDTVPQPKITFEKATH